MRITADNLACERGGRTVFTGVRFSLGEGEMLQLTGPNGSGKSSLLKLLAGLVARTEGHVTVEGGDAELSLGQQAHYLSHLDAFKTALTVRENLQFWSDMLGGSGIGEALAAAKLEAAADFPAAYLSAGQRRRLGLARLSLAIRPIWLLDEPTVGLDSASQQRLQKTMHKHLSAGGLIIAATHLPLGIKPAQELRLGGGA
jgi:heme exporter protein A